MGKKILLYALIVSIFLLTTLIFMVVNHEVFGSYTWHEWCAALWHSLPHHLTVAGYIMAIPLVIELFRPWLPASHDRWHTRFMCHYLAAIAVVVFTACIANTALYGYWGTVLDSGVMLYVMQPKEAFLSTPLWIILVSPLLLVAVYAGVRKWVRLFYLHPLHATFPQPSRLMRSLHTLLALLLCGLDFIAIRGGVTTSTMNPGRAYFSQAMPLNHAATNPVFNFLYSVGKQQAFDKQYRFLSPEECAEAWSDLQRATVSDTTATHAPLSLLRTPRPNILLLILESFSGAACQALYPDNAIDYMPHVSALMHEGLSFTHFYANSYRTDRGVAAILAAYPGCPTFSVMKDQSKCNHLTYLPLQLKRAGYSTQFIIGCDADFTNRRGFLAAGGVTDIVSDVDFPVSERLDKWGVRDDRMFRYVNETLTAAKNDTLPYFKIFLTLSSHEPFEVPYHHYADPYLNSVAYTDSCLGQFFSLLKADTALWNNLLVIGLPDHCFAKYPETVQQHEPLRYHIPMFWTGGALRPLTEQTHEVKTIGSQVDLTATLLAELGLPYDDFPFSKDLLDGSQPHYAFYAFSDGFGLITDSCRYVQDNRQNGKGLQPGTDDPDGHAQRWGQAFLQHLYDDLARR